MVKTTQHLYDVCNSLNNFYKFKIILTVFGEVIVRKKIELMKIKK